MSTTLTAVFDGKVFRPESLPDLEPNTRCVITVETPSLPTKDAWDTLESMAGTIDAPADWAAEHDHYLYGTPKRANNS